MDQIKSNNYIRNISQVKSISMEILEKIEYEIALLDIPWSESYSDYQSSGWKTISLMNNSGHEKDVVIAAFVQGATLTEKGAVTYWYNCRRKAKKAVKES